MSTSSTSAKPAVEIHITGNQVGKSEFRKLVEQYAVHELARAKARKAPAEQWVEGTNCMRADASTEADADATPDPLYLTGYRAGWRWGVADGMVCGCLVTAAALLAGHHWGLLQ